MRSSERLTLLKKKSFAEVPTISGFPGSVWRAREWLAGNQ